MSIDKLPRFIFVTGGVVSSLGKGLVAASAGVLLQSRGFSVCIRKLDPYLNIDPGTISPTQHGEVFVTEDGAETDLDLGHYERFTGVNATRNDNVTAGRIYDSLLKKERKGDYLGQTVQVIPHVTDLIKAFILNNSDSVDFMICEIGGTVGDIESQPFLEAIRQIGYDLGKHRTIFIHLTLVPYLSAANELKTKPTQHSVKELNSVGIQPDIILCRSEQPVSYEQCKKIASFCNVLPDNVVPGVDVSSIYEVPISSYKNGLDAQVLKHFDIVAPEPDLTPWINIVNAINSPDNGEVIISIVGKYIKLLDAYKSLIESLNHAGIYHKVHVKIKWVNSRIFDDSAIAGELSGSDAIIIPGGFGNDGVEGKVAAIKYARTHNIPFLGICMGMQLAVIEFSNNVAGLEDANSVEFDPYCKNPVIALMTSWTNLSLQEVKGSEDYLGGSLRVGLYKCLLKNDSKIFSIYGKEVIEERRRHRYGLDLKYEDVLANAGLIATGRSGDGNLIEVIELKNHPWFIAVQYHPEFKSKPFTPHPIFISLVGAAMEHKKCAR